MSSKRSVALSGDWILHLGSTAISLLIFVVILWLRIPPSISRALSAYSFPLFLVVLLLFYVAFRLRGEYRWLAASCLTMLLLALTLSFLWSSGYSDDKIIGGLLPFRDGFDYFNGADWLLNGQLIKNINEGAAWRPLYPGFLSAVLWLTGRNLQWALAIQVGLAGLCFSLAAIRVRNRLGAAAAALFVTLLYFYIQPLIGTAYTETLGLALGCVGFVMLWIAAERRSMIQLMGGVVILMIAISARAGAFFVFPLLIVWAGWAWRGDGRFSLRHAGLALAAVVLSYLLVNTLYSKLTVEPGGYAFGNFAFTIYGQVNGGAGYHKAFEDLGVRNPAVILRAAERFFVAHPQGFVIGALKAYRDFFSPIWGVLAFGFSLLDGAVWLLGTVLLLYGLYGAVRQIKAPESSLLLAGFIGILLSVPFLPPIDGGIRIYASTMPFVFALPAAGLSALTRWKGEGGEEGAMVATSGTLAGAMGLLTIVAPVLILYLAPTRIADTPNCAAEQVPYAAEVSAGTYIDLLPADAPACGRVPEVCLGAFRDYASLNDPSDAAVFDQLAATAGTSPVRVIAGNDVLGGRPHLFLGPAHSLQLRGITWIAGCATEAQIKGRPSIYTIQSMTVVRPGN